MKIKSLVIMTILLTSTIWSQAQQINPVPDYVFRNQMSVGRNAVTDTAAYFSIGPRYGATKGFMPPIVGDTATFSSGKRNGLLIFSVQKNKFLYWDSVRVQWSDMAGSSGAYIVAGDTASMLAPYLRKADTTAMLSPYYRSATASAALALKLNISDTATMLSPYYRSATATAALATKLNISDTSTMLSPYARTATVNASLATKLNISDTSSMLGNYIRHAGYGLTKSGQSFLVDTLNIATRAWRQKGLDSLAALEVSGSGTTNYVAKFTAASTIGNSQIFDNGTNVGIGTTTAGGKLTINSALGDHIQIQRSGQTDRAIVISASDQLVFGTWASPTQMALTSAGEFLINTTSDAGDYKLQVSGNIYNTGSAVLAATGGTVGIGATANLAPLTVYNPTLNSTVLEVRGGGGSSQSRLVLSYGNATTTTQNALLFSNTSAVGLEASLNRYIYFSTGTSSVTERMRITSDGELIIDASGTDAGDYKLQVSGNIYNTGSAVLAATSGEVLVGTTTDRGAYKFQADGLSFFGSDANSYALLNNTASNAAMQAYGAWTNHLRMTYPAVVDFDFQVTASGELDLKRSSTVATRVNAAREFMINTTTDAGDYHLQVVGNARIGTGKLDIASNTTFGLGVARSGTSEVAGQIYNSNGILYLGAESSAGGQIFSGSSAYAAVIGSGANYPLQFAANNITRATLTTNGNFMIGFPTDTYFYRLQVNGSIFSNNQIIAQNAAAQLNIDSSTNISPLYISNQSLTGSSAQGLLYGSTTWNTTGNPSLIDLAITNTASGSDANYIKISDGSNIFRVTKAAEVVTAAPTGGSIKPWKLGEAATVSPTSPNRTIRVEIDGTVYYLHAKTTND